MRGAGLSETRTSRAQARIIEPEMVRVPEGWFRMGCESGRDDEKPVHRVWVDTFELAAHQATNEEYGCFLAAYRLIKGPQAVSVNGWTTIVVLVLVLSGLQLGVIGMLGEYLWRALDDVRQRPMFLVQELVGDFRNRQQSQETEVRLSIQSSTVP